MIRNPGTMLSSKLALCAPKFYPIDHLRPTGLQLIINSCSQLLIPPTQRSWQGVITKKDKRMAAILIQHDIIAGTGTKPLSSSVYAMTDLEPI